MMIFLSPPQISELIEESYDVDGYNDRNMAMFAPDPINNPDVIALYHTITQEQYDEFKYYFTLDLLAGKRYGQAFCERFGISNASPLYHFHGMDISERWIRDNYLVKE